ncbi:hypothetical protein [Rhodococcus opacus]|uniref:hypothetical protein n=1 Tax=Rhodococcus opacus TaxID=37919 RepID=UPI0024BB7ACC|nr:hypothetical protein [Rhodococcus opacus]MDJ0418843.1 hypothetical protein [Rhodococcus opacus]
MNEDDSIAATSLGATVVLKESEPTPARPAEDGLLSVLLGIVVLSIGGTILAAIPLLFAGATVALAAVADVEASFLTDHSGALWTLAAATTATVLVGGAAVGAVTALGAVRNKRKPNEITGNQLAAAPHEVRELMSDAVLTVETIKDSRAWREGLFTDVDLRAAIWDIGSRVLAATELHDAITAAGESGNGALAPEDDQTYVLSCARIADAVQALRDAAEAVTQLSAELAAADALAQQGAERAERAEQAAGRIGRLVAAQATTPTTPATAVTDLSETITTRTLAYRDLRQT